MSQESDSTGVSGKNCHPACKWILLVLVSLLIALAILCHCCFPPTHLCVRCRLPLWGWILGLLPGLIILHHALYLSLIRGQTIRKGMQGTDPETSGEARRLVKPREAIRAEAKDYFSCLALAVRLGLPALLVMIVGISLIHVLVTLPDSLAWIGLPTTNGVIAGALGAYLYCAFQLGQRDFQHDISSGLAVWSAVQLATGPVVGGAVLYAWRGGEPAPSLSILAVPFLAGFSQRLLGDAAQGMARRLWGGANVQTPRTLPLTAIRGIDDRIQERLNEEGISNVHTLAMANPIHLLRNTPFDKRQIVAWIDEALLMYYLPKSWDTLQDHTITGAIDLAWVWAQDEGAEPSPRIAELATACHLTPAILNDTAQRLYEDAQVATIWALYNGNEGDQTGSEVAPVAQAAAQPAAPPEA